MTARVRLLGRAGCHLCDDARVVVAEVCGSLGVEWMDDETESAHATLACVRLTMFGAQLSLVRAAS